MVFVVRTSAIFLYNAIRVTGGTPLLEIMVLCVFFGIWLADCAMPCFISPNLSLT